MKIRIRRDKRLKGVRYEADCGMIDGKRLAPWFKTKGEAENYISEQKRKQRQFGNAALAFSEADRVRFVAAEQRLVKIGATLEQVIDYFERHHKPLKTDELGRMLTLKQLLDRCLFEKEVAGLEDRSLKQLKSSCLSFVRGREDRIANDVKREDVKAWILGNAFAPKTQRTYLGDVRTMFAFGVLEGYVAANPIAGTTGFIELEPEIEREIPAFDIEDCARLLYTALFATHRSRDGRDAAGRWRFKETLEFRRLIGYVAITMFAGVRPEREAGKTTVAELDLRGRVLLLKAKTTKTRRRRPVELPRVAVIWLRLWRRLCPKETRFIPKNFTRLWRDLREKARVLETWNSDVLRHTAASYHYAEHQNLATLQAWLGHSEDEDTLFRHYRAVQTLTGKVISRAHARRFWTLTPRMVRLMLAPAASPAATMSPADQRAG